jgi:hypothetical protein
MFDTQGFCVIPELLDAAQLERQREALAPWIDDGPMGRNVFEGTRTNRIYAMLAKDPVFAELVAHPVSLAWAEYYLGQSCLLSACLAIHLQPGESAQPWHTDDGHTSLTPPHDLLGVSTFWALDDTTLENGATEVLPGSHRWSETEFPGVLKDRDFATEEDATGRPGGAPGRCESHHASRVLDDRPGRSLASGWGESVGYRALSCHAAILCGVAATSGKHAVVGPAEHAAALPERVRELLGYSIHPPFMGYSDGMHPQRVLP